MRYQVKGIPLAALALLALFAPHPAHARGGDPSTESWVCLRPYLPEPVLRPARRNENASSHYSYSSENDERGGEPRSVWESELWVRSRHSRVSDWSHGPYWLLRGPYGLSSIGGFGHTPY
jgi:hypothetical protein